MSAWEGPVFDGTRMHIRKRKYLLLVWEREIFIPKLLLSSFSHNTMRSCNFISLLISWEVQFYAPLSPGLFHHSLVPVKFLLSFSVHKCFPFTPTSQEKSRFYLWNKLFMYLKLLIFSSHIWCLIGKGMLYFGRVLQRGEKKNNKKNQRKASAEVLG